jgi:S-adenosylmethionine decarboxylase
MAFNDTLFQLGMDLTRSSPAQKEEFVAGSARVESGDRNTFVERDSVRFAGSHLIIDLIGASRMDDRKHVDATVRRCLRASPPSVMSAQLVRTPSKGVATFDVFMANGSDAFDAVDQLRAAFGAREAVLKAHKRCDLLPSHVVAMGARRSKPQAKVARPRKAA